MSIAEGSPGSVDLSGELRCWPDSPIVKSGDGNFHFTVGEGVCNANGILFGGWALGALAEVGAAVTGLRLRELTANYLAPIARGECVRVVPHILQQGRTVAQVRLDIWSGDTCSLAATAVLGPSIEPVGAPKSMPQVRAPDHCPRRTFATGGGTGSSVLLETRVVSETRVGALEPRTLLWVAVDADVLGEVRSAVVSDHVPTLVRRSIPGLDFVPTVSGAVVVIGAATSRYLLLDVRLVAWDSVVASGEVDIWNADGTLVAWGRQTCRLFDGHARPSLTV